MALNPTNKLNLNSQEDLRSQASQSSFVKDMYAKNYQSLTPARYQVQSPNNSRNSLVPNVQSLDRAMMIEDQKKAAEDQISTVESYKRRSNSYFENPMLPPKELFVPVPQQVKPAPHRTPFYRQ